MKQLTCDMCGSTDLMKHEGVFVCQSCGVKYSVEEAKHMMIKGTIEITGTIKVDESDKIDNYLEIAGIAQVTGNYSEAKSYCNRILEIDSDNYQAWFIKGKVAGWQYSLANSRLIDAVECFDKAIDYAPENKVDEVKKDAVSEIKKMNQMILTLCCNHFIKQPNVVNAGIIFNNAVAAKMVAEALMKKSGVSDEMYEVEIANKVHASAMTAWNEKVLVDYQRVQSKPNNSEWEEFRTGGMACVAVLQVLEKLSQKDADADIQRYKEAITITERIMESCSWTKETSSSGSQWVRDMTLSYEGKQGLIDHIMKFHQKIKAIDPAYVIPKRPVPSKQSAASDRSVHEMPKMGCYIATSVYGSYDCPQVWTLRRYRDFTLNKTTFGRMFTRTYYAVQPYVREMVC